MRTKFIVLLVMTLFTTFFAGCTKKSTNTTITTKNNSVTTLYDYAYELSNNHELSDDDFVESKISDFPNVIFRCSCEKLLAIKDGEETVLLYGMPVLKIFATDLNGDKMPELCATINIGSGICDRRVIIIDYAKNKYYDISDTMEYDFELFKQDEKLIITRTPNNKQNSNEHLTGNYLIKNNQIIIEYTNGETKTVEATNLSK